MKTTINRGKFSTFYHSKGFSLMVVKSKSLHPDNMLTFMIGEYDAATVLISRKEAAHTLKKFKKVLAKS